MNLINNFRISQVEFYMICIKGTYYIRYNGVCQNTDINLQLKSKIT